MAAPACDLHHPCWRNHESIQTDIRKASSEADRAALFAKLRTEYAETVGELIGLAHRVKSIHGLSASTYQPELAATRGPRTRGLKPSLHHARSARCS